MKIQKQLCLFLAFFVLVSNVGFALKVHYCDDQIASISFNADSPSNIDEDCCGVAQKVLHCCKDKVVLIQKKSDQAVVKSFAFEWQYVTFSTPWILVPHDVQIPLQNTNVAAYYCESNAPPLFKLYAQYIFYDLV